MSLRTRYNGYPHFQACLDTLREEYQERRAHVFQKWSKTPCNTTNTHAYQVERDAIDKEYHVRVEQAHRTHNVPVLSDWEDALKTTGQATYHDCPPRSYRPLCQATLTRSEKEPVLTLELHQVYTIPQQEMPIWWCYLDLFPDLWTPSAPQEAQTKQEGTADER